MMTSASSGSHPGRHLDGEERPKVIRGTGDATTAKNQSNAAHESAGYAARLRTTYIVAVPWQSRLLPMPLPCSPMPRQLDEATRR